MRNFFHCAGIRNPGLSGPLRPSTVVTENETIQAILPGHIEPDENSSLISWEGCVVIPGLFSCHEHITLDSVAEHVPDAEVGVVFALRAVKVCSRFLQNGVTTVRDAGSRGAANIQIKKGLQEGLFSVPDLVVPGHRISRTGFTKWRVCLEADGPENLRKAVRQERKRGAEFIKLMVSDVLSGQGTPYDPQYSFDEIRAAVEEAHELGLKISVHAYGGEGATRAIRAGVDSIEHGASLSDEDIEMMAENGTFYVMTYKAVFDAAADLKTPPRLRETAESMIERYHDTLCKVRKAGVRVAAGGDSHGFDPSMEATAMLRSGFTHAEALAALTVNGAALCGMPDKGVVREGFIADLVALDGDPLEDIHALGKVRGVAKKGQIIRPCEGSPEC